MRRLKLPPRVHSYERLERLESWVTRLSAAVALIVGAAMAVGLLTATGHVTW